MPRGFDAIVAAQQFTAACSAVKLFCCLLHDNSAPVYADTTHPLRRHRHALWPVSREAHPKPFIKLADGRSLLQKTLDRLAPLEDIGEVITVTNREYFFVTRDEYAAGGSSLSPLLRTRTVSP